MAEKLEPSPKAYRININNMEDLCRARSNRTQLGKILRAADTLETDVPIMLALWQTNSPNGLLSMSSEDEECRHGIR